MTIRRGPRPHFSNKMRPRPCQLGFTQQQQGPGGQSVSSVQYGLSANGELLDDGLRRYRYDPDGRLAAVTTGADDTAPTTRYAHNALGQRTFKTEPQYSPVQGDEADPGFWQSLLDFFAQLWSPATTATEKLGRTSLYDPQGTLLGDYGNGGASTSGTTEYIYLPTPNGPVPIVALIKGAKHAIHADHLNTPRKLTRAGNRVVWQWAYSAFGEEAPTLGADRYTNPETTPGAGTTTIPRVEFNLRYPGQYFDREANLSYNYHRSYDARTGRYTQADPIGLEGGWNRFAYVEGNPLGLVDPEGLQSDRRPNRPNWPDFMQPTQPNRNCATAECAAGLPPTTPDNRTQKEMDYGQCKLVCQTSLLAPVAICNAIAGGGLAGAVAGAVAKGGLCTWVCK